MIAHEELVWCHKGQEVDEGGDRAKSLEQRFGDRSHVS